jgi:hypothetical protein
VRAETIELTPKQGKSGQSEVQSLWVVRGLGFWAGLGASTVFQGEEYK